MNSSRKNRQIDALSRVRKRKSIGKPASSVSCNASQKHASLLKNNKGLARTLQETRCELSLYKNFYEESLEFINKTKHAKSRMTQLFVLLKNCLETFGENLSLMEFDESKLSIIKPPVQSTKSFQTEMKPVPEVAGELLVDQEMTGEKENSPRDFDPVPIESADTAKPDDPAHTSRSPQKKTNDLVGNDRGFEQASHSENVKDNKNEGAEVPEKTIGSSDLQNCLPLASLPSQAGKVTRIPRVLGIHLGKQASRKLPEKDSDAIVSKLLRRKTFVVRNNVITLTESSNKTGENEIEQMNSSKNGENETAQPQLLISIADKRQTFVIKQKEDARKRLEETKSASTLISTVDDKEPTFKSIINSDESKDVQDDILQNKKRKTFVKKTALHEKDLEFQVAEEPVTKNKVNVDQCKDAKHVSQNKKRKTIVKKPALHENDLESQVLEEHVTKNRVNVCESKDVQDVLQNKRRKTFLKKPSLDDNGDLQSLVSERPVTRGTVNLDEIEDVQHGDLQNKKRKTVVKKATLLLDCQTSSPNKGSPSVNPEIFSAIEDHGDETQRLKSSHTLHKEHSETDHVTIKNILVPVQNSANIQEVEDHTTTNSNKTLGTASKIMPSGSNNSDKSKEMLQNCNLVVDNVDTVQKTTEVAIMLTDVITENVAVESRLDENVDKMHEVNLKRDHGSFLDSSESGLMSMVQHVNFKEFEMPPPLIQTTPIRGQITKREEKKFFFNSKKRKTVVIRKSQSKTEKDENVMQESVEAHASGDDVITNSAQVMSEEVVNTDDLCNIPAAKEKMRRSPRKKDRLKKTDLEKRASKIKKVKNPKDSSADIEVDVLTLSSQSKKFKKNLRKKKTGSICFEEDKITKFVAERKSTKVKKVKKVIKELESDPPDNHMVQTGTNNSGCTWLLQADIEHLPSSFSVPDTDEMKNKNNSQDVQEVVSNDIHPPQSSLNVSSNEQMKEECKKLDQQTKHPVEKLKGIHPPQSALIVSDNEQMNKENKRLGLPHMQVAIVLDDILKSKSFETLNINDNLLNVSFKASLPRNISNIEINTDESMERLRSEPDGGDSAVQTDAILENSNPNVLADPVPGKSSPTKSDDIELIELEKENPRNRRKKACVKYEPVLSDDVEVIDLDIENPRSRRRKNVSYKEKPLNVKMRRN